LSSARQSNIIYSENDWNDIVQKYNLYTELEIVIRQESVDSSSDTIQNHSASWVLRAFAVAGVLTLLGNFPAQSHLITPPDSNNTFKISKQIDAVIPTTTPTINIATQQPYSNELTSDEKIIKISDFDPHAPLEPQELELALPKRALETYAGHVAVEQNSKWKTYHVKSYDNLTNIFHKIGHQKILNVLKADKTLFSELKELKKNSIVRASSNSKGDLSELVLTHDTKNSFIITLNENDEYVGAWKKDVFEIRQSRSSFTIKNGLFFDGRKTGVANQIIKQIVKVFDWDIDFSHDIRVGDKVTAVFEEIYHDGDKVGVQNLLAAEFINKNHEFRAIRYTNKDGKADYFTPQGREMKKAFIRTPISHARVSSHFNPGRFHPKLHKIRAHKGTDFAARTGTPIMATGNGTIISLGRKGGYGRTIVIKHREGYTTVYAHMSRYKKKLKQGDKVYQGDIIGYVGQSGLATGPHLHYEFRKSGKAIDSMRADLPNSMSLTSSELRDFRNKAINLVLQLNVLHRFVKAKIEINSAIGG